MSTPAPGPPTPSQLRAIARINAHFKKWFRFYLVGADPAGEEIALTGSVLNKEIKHEASEFAGKVWSPTLCQITIAFHMLVLYHLVIDTFLVAVAFWPIHLLPHGDPILDFVHTLGNIVIFSALILHMAWVLFTNLEFGSR